MLHAHSCAVRPGSGAIPDLGTPPTGDHPADTEPSRSLQDRQKPAHPSSVSKINYVRIAADCLDRELSGRSPSAIWTPHANRRPSVSSSTPAKNTPLRCAILSDAFPPRLPLVIGQTRVRDFNWVGAHRGHRRRTHHVAALTTSLPETPGGERNWDYRYTWMRDTTFTLQALHFLNLDLEANEFIQFVADLEPNEDGALQIMYGIDGRRDLAESTREDLSGYAGARPVRFNGAFDQRQNDVFGAVLDSILLHTRRSGRLPQQWPIVKSRAQGPTAVWREPDQGIWEARGKPQHYVSFKLMGWVASDRASKLAGIRGDSDLAATWQAIADEIKGDILAYGVDKRGVLRQHYDTDALDASTLLAAIFGLLPPTTSGCAPACSPSPTS